mmetsp:Transcript_21436/g.63248  ORF Transcript_21436/g.63248 Transcript_21436/m.63248 type:complete len:923 (-) Transcript_21436:121-2889(-)
MHGLVHLALAEWLRSEGPPDAWSTVCSLAMEDLHCGEASLLEMKQYTDEDSRRLLCRSIEVSGTTWEHALRRLGAYHVDCAAKLGFLNLLRAMGSDLESLLRNLNNLHSNLERSFRQSALPCFDIVHEADGSTILSYSSSRVGLEPLVEGAVPRISAVLFGKDVAMVPIATTPGFARTWRVESRGDSAVKVPEVTTKASFSVFHDAMVSILKSADMFPPDDDAEGAEQEHLRLSEPGTRLSPGIRAAVLRQLDDTQVQLAATDSPTHLLMRAVHPLRVCADWSAPSRLERTAEFWADSCGRLEDFIMSKPVADTPEAQIVFVSHVWLPPPDWERLIGHSTPYSHAKAMELSFGIRDMQTLADREDGGNRARHGERRQDIRLWLDKACCPQEHDLLRNYVERIGGFLSHSDAMVVLMPWTYFDRLWCLFEWTFYLIHHEPRHVHVCTEMMMSARNVDLYVDAVRRISVRRTHCLLAADTRVVQRLVDAHFDSEEALEDFARCTAIGILARSSAKRAARHTGGYLKKWCALADECGLVDLAAALRKAEPKKWRAECLAGACLMRLRPCSGSGAGGVCGAAHACGDERRRNLSVPATPTALFDVDPKCSAQWEARGDEAGADESMPLAVVAEALAPFAEDTYRLAPPHNATPAPTVKHRKKRNTLSGASEGSMERLAELMSVPYAADLATCRGRPTEVTDPPPMERRRSTSIPPPTTRHNSDVFERATWQEEYVARVEAWFRDDVQPVLLAHRERAVRRVQSTAVSAPVTPASVSRMAHRSSFRRSCTGIPAESGLGSPLNPGMSGRPHKAPSGPGVEGMAQAKHLILGRPTQRSTSDSGSTRWQRGPSSILAAPYVASTKSSDGSSMLVGGDTSDPDEDYVGAEELSADSPPPVSLRRASAIAASLATSVRDALRSLQALTAAE